MDHMIPDDNKAPMRARTYYVIRHYRVFLGSITAIMLACLGELALGIYICSTLVPSDAYYTAGYISSPTRNKAKARAALVFFWCTMPFVLSGWSLFEAILMFKKRLSPTWIASSATLACMLWIIQMSLEGGCVWTYPGESIMTSGGGICPNVFAPALGWNDGSFDTYTTAWYTPYSVIAVFCLYVVYFSVGLRAVVVDKRDHKQASVPLVPKDSSSTNSISTSLVAETLDTEMFCASTSDGKEPPSYVSSDVASADSYNHLKVDIFESRPAFKEEGAAIGIATNALKALQDIDPELLQCLDRAGAVEENDLRAFISSGADSGEIFHTQSSPPGEILVKSVARAPFLSEILKTVPESCMHTAKRMIEIKQSEDDSYTIYFEDGTEEKFDIVFGTDGIHSSVRKYVLGEDEPSSKAVGAGWWFYFVLVPMEEARAILGDWYLDKPRQQVFTGHGHFTLVGWTNDKTSIWGACGARMEEGFDKTAWEVEMTEEKFNKHFENDSEMIHNLAKLLYKSAPPGVSPFCMFHHPTTSTYFKGRVAIVGDAAHAPTPWQGSGGAQSAEDAVILSALLARISKREEITAALKAYDQIRRPRCQSIIDSSYEVGLLATGVKPGVELNVEKLRAKMKHKWDHILPYDITTAKPWALEVMASLLSQQG
ncbi:hypothetical protein M409DRAFT_25489 [Zasmidium cellare ATCC 36951]|uniref:FAD-binding domain-containing protein n=1 Tax=Zasmidium cellare ATCC 36951 TaxID=1080233 RepID=A0A6A6CDZ5_ZASCE|nr:uncharacterized protein M409DRAFT_25489 [Zasmidium cellare ATCC 36951]KAF2164142.1 hypothetical protein M409DRAFT_25489 [Zasmidium cellare ATCC 36951]